MQFYFIRHAQSANNHLFATTGSSDGRSQDPELTELGKQQAAELACYLHANDFGITHLYCSLMTRSIETAFAVAKPFGLTPVVWEDFHETGGIYLDDAATGTRVGKPGNNRAHFESRYPDLILPDSLGDAGWWNRPFEEREQRPARAARVLADLLARHGNTDDRVVAISHGGFFNYILAAILKMESREAYWFGCQNVSITRVDFDADATVVHYVNRIEWLAREMVS